MQSYNPLFRAFPADSTPQYNQSNNQDYGSYNPYGQGGNPYAQQDNHNPAYGGRPPPQEQNSSYYADEERQGGYGENNSVVACLPLSS